MTCSSIGSLDVFSLVTRNLLSLGSCTLDKLAGTSDEKFRFDIGSYDLPSFSSTVSSHSDSNTIGPASQKDLPNVSDDQTSSAIFMKYVAQLHDICKQTFGNAEVMQFEYVEEDPDRKQCILTITRPNGVFRSYSSEPIYKRKSDAKAHAAKVALELGAVDFIVHGIKDQFRLYGGASLAPLGASASSSANKAEETSAAVLDDSSKQIQDCCSEWRAETVVPRWVYFSHSDGTKRNEAYGCALSIDLSAHVQRVYSVRPTFPDEAAARGACSALALQEGVLDFIKFGNGQIAPTTEGPKEQEQIVPAKASTALSVKSGRPGSITLQEFFDSLPKPFPESRGTVSDGKPAVEINAPGVLNTILQVAKGARFSVFFHNIVDSKTRMHGCLLRLERPSETRSYMVENKFVKRADAKSAVCLQAFSQGIGNYIREVAANVENKITPEMRKVANERILPILGSEYSKVRFGVHPMYEFAYDQGAFGCTMILELTADPTEDQKKRWSVSTEFRTKADAKIALICQAGREAIEFVRFRGGPVPDGHDVFEPFRHEKGKDKDKERAKGKEKEKEKAEGAGPKSKSVNDGDSDMQSVSMDLDQDEGSVGSSTRAQGSRTSSKKKKNTIKGVASGLVKLGTAEGRGRKRKAEDSSRHSDWKRQGRQATDAGQTRLERSDISAAATAVIERLTQSATNPPPQPNVLPAPASFGWNAPPAPNPGYYFHANGPYQTPMYGQPFPNFAPPPGQFQNPTYPQMQQYPWHHQSAYVMHHHAQTNGFMPSAHHNSHAPSQYSSFPPPVSQPEAGMSQSRPSSSSSRDPNAGRNELSTLPHEDKSQDRKKRERSRSPEGSHGQGDANKKRKAERDAQDKKSPIVEVKPDKTPIKNKSSSSDRGPRQRSNVELLNDYCKSQEMDVKSLPVFHGEKVSNANGSAGHKVWVIMGTKKFELPLVFKTADEGRERLARQVLQRLKSGLK